MIFTHVVLRAFDTGGRTLAAGDRVDASTWRNTERLVTTKYLRPAHDADRVAAKSATPARRVSPPLKKIVVRKATRK